MGDNLKQHNPNFIVLQSGIGVWLWVIWSNLCTLAQSLFLSRHLNKKKENFRFLESTVSIIHLRVQNHWLRWLQIPNWELGPRRHCWHLQKFGQHWWGNTATVEHSLVTKCSTEVLLFDWKFLISIRWAFSIYYIFLAYSASYIYLYMPNI